MKKLFLTLLLMLFTISWSWAITEFEQYNLKFSEYRTGKSVYCEGLSASAHRNTSVTTITIPGWVTYNGVTYNVEGIDAYAFYQEYYLKNVTVAYGVKNIMGGAFSSCTSLKSIKLPSSVTKIGSNAFDNTYIDDLYLCWLTMPEIADDAFSGAGLAQWRMWAPTLPALHAMQRNTALKKVTPKWGVDPRTTWDVSVSTFPCIVTKASTSSSIGEVAIIGWTYSGSMVVNNNAAVSMGDYQLTGKSYYITEIADSVFAGNSTITSVTLPASMKRVGKGAFRNAKTLTTVSVAAEVVDEHAFRGCSVLATLNLNEGIRTLSSYATYGCPKLETVNISSTLLNASPQYNFASNTSIKKYTVSSNNPMFSSDSYGALYNREKTRLIHCPAITSISLPSTLESLGYCSFAGFLGTQVVIPFGVTTSSNVVFVDNPNLKFVKFPSTLTTFEGSQMFSNCPNLQEFMFGALTPPSSFKYADMFGLAATNPEIPANLKIKVPARSLQLYKNSWTTMANRIYMGAFDVMLSGIYVLLDKDNKRAFLTYADDEFRNNRSVNISGNLEVSSVFSFRNVDYTVYGVDSYAYYGLTSLNELLLPPSIINIGANFIGNNKSGFRCYVPNEQMWRYVNVFKNSVSGWEERVKRDIFIYLRRTDDQTAQTFTPYYNPVVIPDAPNFYTVTTFNAGNRMLTTSKVSAGRSVNDGTGMLVTGMEKNKIYRFDKPSSGSTISNLLVGNNMNPENLNTTAYKQYYFDGQYFQALQASEVSTYRNNHPGEAILSLNRANVTSVNTFMVDCLSDGIRGDVDGNSIVNGSDVTALYNFLLNAVAPNGNADVDGNGIVNGSDVTALYNILLAQ